MRFRILALTLAGTLGLSLGLLAGPVAPVQASERVSVGSEIIDGWNDEMGMPPGGFKSEKWQHYIKKMTQPMSPGKPRKFYPLTPSSSKFRAFMITTLGSVLGAATPDKWAREQLANENKYNFSWEKMEQDIAAGRTAGGVPETIDDYTLHKKDWKSKNEDKVPKKAGRAPATRSSPLAKGVGSVGGGLIQLTGLPIGMMIGNGILSMNSVDTEGQLCSTEPDNAIATTLAGVLNGVDCDAWSMTQEAKAAANADQQGGYAPLTACFNGRCVNVVSVASFTQSNGQGQSAGCLTVTPEGASVSITRQFDDGATLTGYAPAATPSSVTGSVDSAGEACIDVSPLYAPFTRFNAQSQWANVVGVGITAKAGDTGTPTVEPLVQVPSDPDRTMSCAVTGSDGLTYSQSATGTYRESDGKIVPPTCPPLPEGVTPQEVTIADDKGNDYYKEPTTQPYRDWSTAAPDCGDGSCPLDLLVKSTDGTTIASCFDLGAGCHGWFEAEDRDTRFECRQDGKKLQLKECFLYAETFSSQRSAIGSPYSDPETGVWTGGKNSTNNLGESAMGMPVQNPDVMRNCLKNGWTDVNPIEWVMVPVDCALQKAFVPRAAVVELAGVTSAGALNSRAPGQLAAVAAGWEFSPAMTGCKKTVTLPAPFPGSPPTTTDVWNACPGGPHETLGLWSRWISALAFGVMVIMLVRRGVAGTVDYKGH